MTKHTKPALAIAAVLVGITLTAWWVQRPQRTTEKFAGHLSHERYEEAALMLNAPSAIEVTPDGGLILIDHAGNSTAVPATKLPFRVGGGEPDRPGDFSMTALGSSANGFLETPPVIIYLRIQGGKIRIESVDS
jgi:hypothetical protein